MLNFFQMRHPFFQQEVITTKYKYHGYNRLLAGELYDFKLEEGKEDEGMEQAGW